MILADSSIWINHIRLPDIALSRALRASDVLIHPFVLGEIALGSIKDRRAVVAALGALPHAVVARSHEVLAMVEDLAPFGTGIGYIDAHLIASTLLTPGTTLWPATGGCTRRRCASASHRRKEASGANRKRRPRGTALIWCSSNCLLTASLRFLNTAILDVSPILSSRRAAAKLAGGGERHAAAWTGYRHQFDRLVPDRG